ncbi:hypothetical protein D3C80_1253420 [compost metagenome]
MDNNDRGHNHVHLIGLVHNHRNHWVSQNDGGDIDQDIRYAAADLVGEPTKERDGNKANGGADHQGVGWDSLLKQQGLHQITGQEGLDQTGVACLTETQPGSQPEGFAAEHCRQRMGIVSHGVRRCCGSAVVVNLFKHRAFFQVHTQPDGEQHNDHAGQERYAPAPGQQLFFRQEEEHYGPDCGCRQRAAIGAHGHQ